MAQSSTRVEALSAAMMERFGGVDGLADALKSHIDAATKRYPGSRAVGTLLQSVVRMVEESDRAEAESVAEIEESIQRMPTEELEQMLEGYRAELIRQGHSAAEIDAILDQAQRQFDPLSSELSESA